MSESEFPHDSAMDAVRKVVAKSADQMGLDEPEWLDDSFEGCDEAEIWERLKSYAGGPLIILGDWRKNLDVDVYDVALRFAESHYSHVRQEKFLTGPFSLIMEFTLASW